MREKALTLLNIETAQCETKNDYAFVLGLAEMAFTLGAITQNEKANYNELACNRMQAAEKIRKEREKELAAERKAKAKEYKEEVERRKKELGLC